MTLSKTSFTYNGKVQKPEVTSVKAGDEELAPSEYSVRYSDENSKDAGEYNVDVYLSGDSFSLDEITGVATYTIKKAANPLWVSGKTATVKKKKLKKKAQTVAAASVMDVRGARGSVTYSLIGVQKAKYRKYFSVNAYTGNVTVKKKLRKGTYTLTVNVKAAGNNNYNAASKNVVYRIKVK